MPIPAQQRSIGFTLVEILIVIGIILVLTFPVLITYRSSRANQALRASAEHFADDIRTAHIFARESKDKRAWGIKRVDSDSYALMSGPVDAPHTEQNFHLEQGITFVNDFAIWFVLGTGETGSEATIKIANANGKQISISIIKSGSVEVSSITP